MRQIKAVRIPGRNPGEVFYVQDNVAETYLANGQAVEVSGVMQSPANRMVDTGSTKSGAVTKDAEVDEEGEVDEAKPKRTKK